MLSQKKILTVAGMAIAAAFMLAGCDQETSGQGQGRAPEVGVVTIKPQKLAVTRELVGRTSPYLIAEVRPQVTGIVLKREFREGADVKAGQSLYQIDSALYKADYASAKADLARADANATTARLKAKRFTELVSIDAVSKQEYDDAVASLKQAEASVAAAKASVDRAEINLRYTHVASPITGRIGKSSVTAGALVTVNQENALATVQQLDPIYVDLTQSSLEMLQLKQEIASGNIKLSDGKKVKVKLLLEDGSAYPFEGTLEFSGVTVDPGTGTVTLRALFPNPKHNLLPGMYVRAVLNEGVNTHALLAPQRAISRDRKGNATALVVSKDGKVEERIIVADRAIGDQWLISEGLNPGDQVIVEGVHRVMPGVPVKTVELKSATSAAPTARARQ